MARLVLLIFCLGSLIYANGQNNYDNCGNAFQLCPDVSETLNNLNATSTVCPNCEDDFSFCFTGENTIWMTFTTNQFGGDVTLDFSNLQFQNNPNQGTSLQATVIAATLPCIASSYTVVSNCESNAANPFTLTALNLQPSTVYYVVVNGAMGNTTNAEAQFDVTLSGGGVVQSPEFFISTEDTVVCEGNEVVLEGNTLGCNDSSSFTWYLNGAFFAETAGGLFVAEGIMDGDQVYAEITCFDSSSCAQTLTSNTLTFTVLDFELDAGPDLVIEQGSTIALQATSDVPNVMWTPSTNMNDPTLINPLVNASETTTYFLMGDNGSCTKTDEMTLTVLNSLEIPNTITPNGDGVNDTWEIIGIEKFPNCDVRIYNRWGQEVFRATSYSKNKEWNGTSKSGNELPSSAYYYVIDLRSDDFPDPIKGNVSIIR
jgi:gliding motility-associated-like protein